MNISEKVCYDTIIRFSRSIFLKGQFGSLNLQFRFWLPDCPLSVAEIILLFHTNGEGHSNVISKMELKISTAQGQFMGAFFTNTIFTSFP